MLVTFLMNLDCFFHIGKWFNLFLSNTNKNSNDKTVLLQFSINNISCLHTESHLFTFFFVYIQLNDQTVIFRKIPFSMSTKLNSSTYCCVSLTIQLNINHLITHNEIIKQFYFKQFILAWVHSLNVKQFYLIIR